MSVLLTGVGAFSAAKMVSLSLPAQGEGCFPKKGLPSAEEVEKHVIGAINQAKGEEEIEAAISCLGQVIERYEENPSLLPLQRMEFARIYLLSAQLLDEFGIGEHNEDIFKLASAQYRRAFRELEEKRGIRKSHYADLITFGRLLSALGETAEARSIFEKAIKINIPAASVEAERGLGDIATLEKDWNEAVAQYEVALRSIKRKSWTPTKAEHSDFLGQLAVAYRYREQKGDLATAVTLLEQANELDPGNLTGLFNLACGYALQNNFEKSDGTLRALLVKAKQQGENVFNEYLDSIEKDDDLKGYRSSPLYPALRTFIDALQKGELKAI